MSQPSWIGYSLNNRYKIKELVGKGGMSTVYKATDPNLRRDVAVKLIHSHLTDDPEFVRRFEEEAAAVARLNHPNIIHVYDFNKDGDVYYMILELLNGETLQARLKRLSASKRRLPLEDAIKITLGMCDALAYAHSQGMVHRDIKPANIMLTAQGRTILMDFGVVKMLDTQQHTSTGAVIGTALYMSPEQARGERPDTRADIYSLGVSLFEMISGRPPFEADSTMAMMRMHVNDPVPDIRDLAPGTPAALKAIIEKALAKNRDDRYQTMPEMAADLSGLLSELGISVSSPTINEPAQAEHMATNIETKDSLGTAKKTRARPTSDSGGGGPSWLLIGGIGAAVVAAIAVVALVALPALQGGSDQATATEAGVGNVTVTIEASEPAETSAPTETPESTAMSMAVWLTENTDIVVSIEEERLIIRADDVQELLALPLHPTEAAAPQDLPAGRIGVAINGVLLYSPFTPEGNARPLAGFDQCNGSEDREGFYHYFVFSSCAFDSIEGYAPFGIAFDGYTIYGPNEANDEPASDLDACHGHNHATVFSPAGEYHYHTRNESPYILGCFHGVIPEGLLPPTGGSGGGAITPPPTPIGGGGPP